MIELRHLQHILTLAEKGVFRKAASELHISQPALTKSIQKAETLFGVRLFDRSSNGVEPTPFGKIIAARARLLLRDADAITRDVRIMARLEGGELRVGVSPYVIEVLKRKILGGFLARFPKIRIQLTINHWEYLLEMLFAKSIDIFVGDVGELDRTISIHIDELAREKIIWYCHPGHPLVAKETVSPKDAAAFPIVAPYRPRRLDQWLRQVFADTPLIRRQDKIAFALECDDYDVLRRTAASSDCIGALPQSSLKEAFRKGELVELPFNPSVPRSAAGIVYLKDRMLPPAAEVLIKDIINRFEEMTRSKNRIIFNPGNTHDTI